MKIGIRLSRLEKLKLFFAALSTVWWPLCRERLGEL